MNAMAMTFGSMVAVLAISAGALPAQANAVSSYTCVEKTDGGTFEHTLTLGADSSPWSPKAGARVEIETPWGDKVNLPCVNRPIANELESLMCASQDQAGSDVIYYLDTKKRTMSFIQVSFRKGDQGNSVSAGYLSAETKCVQTGLGRTK